MGSCHVQCKSCEFHENIFVFQNVPKTPTVPWKLSPITQKADPNLYQVYQFHALSNNPKFVDKLWPHPKIMYKTRENEKANDTSSTPNWKITLHQQDPSSNFVLSEILSKIRTFYPHKPKYFDLTNSLLAHYLWPKEIQKDPKNPNLKFIFTNEQMFTRKLSSCLRCSVAHVLVAQNWATFNWWNFLKSPETSR